jgi:hypothetical protein
VNETIYEVFANAMATARKEEMLARRAIGIFMNTTTVEPIARTGVWYDKKAKLEEIKGTAMNDWGALVRAARLILGKERLEGLIEDAKQRAERK